MSLESVPAVIVLHSTDFQFFYMTHSEKYTLPSNLAHTYTQINKNRTKMHKAFYNLLEIECFKNSISFVHLFKMLFATHKIDLITFKWLMI
jgi:hypothetical protein